MEIINKVAQSSLEVFDLEDLYPVGFRSGIDLSQWLLGGIILKEKDFRSSLKEVDWSEYSGHYVAIFCTTDAIVPAWAKMLITSYLQPFAKQILSCSVHEIDGFLYHEILSKIDFSKYLDKPVIVKGCSKKPVPESAYVLAVQNLMPFAKSIMYGEACSAVPLYKKS